MEGECNDAFRVANGKSNTVPTLLPCSSLQKDSAIGDRLFKSFSYYMKFSLLYEKRLEGLTSPLEQQSHRLEKVVDLLNASDMEKDPNHVRKEKEFHITLITHKYPIEGKVIYKFSSS